MVPRYVYTSEKKRLLIVLCLFVFIVNIFIGGVAKADSANDPQGDSRGDSKKEGVLAANPAPGAMVVPTLYELKGSIDPGALSGFDAQEAIRAAEIFKAAKMVGFSDAVSAAIVGNAHNESSCSYPDWRWKVTSPNNCDGNVLQWEYNGGGDGDLRLAFMTNFSRTTGIPYDNPLSGMVYLWNETFNPSHSDMYWIGKRGCVYSTADQFASASDPAAVAEALCKYYMRAGTPDMNLRKNTANMVYEAWSGKITTGNEIPLEKAVDLQTSGAADGAAGNISEAARQIAGMGVVAEGDLIGLKGKPNYMQGWSDLPESKYENLSQQQKENINELISDINLRKSYTFQRYIRIGYTIVGIVMLFYALFLLIAWLFDGINILFDISFISILTFNRYRRVPKGIQYNFGTALVSGRSQEIDSVSPDGKTRYMTIARFIYTEIILVVIGYSLCSGLLVQFIGNIIIFVMNHVGTV